MQTPPAFGFKELLTHIVGDMAKAVCERNGETKQQQLARTQAAAHMIMGFLPRDVIETILAGHCVMFHELMTDSVRDTLRGEVDTMRRATRSTIVAMDKAFGNNLTRLERYQRRPAEGQRDAPEAVRVAARTAERTSPPVASAHVAAAHVAKAQTVPSPAGADDAAARAPVEAAQTPVAPESTGTFTPSPEAIAACRANPEAMAALNAGDAEGFARAMGIDMPSEAYLDAAAAPGSVFDRGVPPKITPDSFTPE